MSTKPLEPIEKAPAYEQVCARLRRAIHLGEYVAGNRLPSERNLSIQLGVSRVTLREAIRVLEGEGYVTTTGRGGGSRITVSRRKAKSTGLDNLEVGPEILRMALRSRLDEIDHLFDFRRANESFAARLAALRRSDEDLQRFHNAIEAMRATNEVPEFRSADSEFHIAIADVSANPYLQKAIEDARADMFRPLDILDDIDVTLTDSLNDHSNILRAIEAGDPDQAEIMMTKHIERARKEIRRVILDE